MGSTTTATPPLAPHSRRCRRCGSRSTGGSWASRPPSRSPATRRFTDARRLERNLRAIGSGHVPERRVVELALEHRNGRWWQRDEEGAVDVGAASDAAVVRSHKLAEDTAHVRRAKAEKMKGGRTKGGVGQGSLGIG